VGWPAGRTRAGAGGVETSYAMNMRAAEATVSSAPKPMKIFPIREVWSQAELSVLFAATGLAGTGAGGGTGASAAAGAAGALSCSV